MASGSIEGASFWQLGICRPLRRKKPSVWSSTRPDLKDSVEAVVGARVDGIANTDASGQGRRLVCVFGGEGGGSLDLVVLQRRDGELDQVGVLLQFAKQELDQPAESIGLDHLARRQDVARDGRDVPADLLR